MESVLQQKPPTINGDGSYSRDFTFIANVIDANEKALFTANTEAVNQVYNIAFGESTTLLQLFQYINEIAGSTMDPVFGPFRTGDIPHSLANIDKAKRLLNYSPKISVREGLAQAFAWYQDHLDFYTVQA